MSARSWSWESWRDATERLLEALDWKVLGDLYFHEQGLERWQQMRPHVLELGEAWAKALLKRVPEGGRSLYVGAGVAELPVLIAERCVRGRSLRAVNRSTRECEVLMAGLEKVGLAGHIQIEPVDGALAATKNSFDHVSCVSLFSDPETWPMLSGVTYGRIAPVQLDVDAFVREREQARGLAAALFASLRRPGLVTTSAEELGWFLDAAAPSGAEWEAEDEMIPTAVVGDPIGFVHFR
jgi:hypothetical protein